jgi:inner membrane transporter RhtA
VVLVAVPDRTQAQAVDPLARVPPLALILAGIVSVQVGAALAVGLFDDVGAAGAVLLRIGFGALILTLVVRPRWRGRPRADLGLIATFGVVLGVMNLTFYEALDHIPLGIAVTIEFWGPLAVAVIGSRRPLDLVWVVLAAAGIVLLAKPGGGGVDAFGLACAAAAGLCWALYIVLAARAGPRFRGADGVAMAMVIAAIIPIGPGIADGGSALLRPEVLAIGVGVGVLSTAIPYALETEALRRIPRHVFSVLMSLEPAVAALAGFVIIGQDLDTLEIVAVILVVIASAGASRNAEAIPDT